MGSSCSDINLGPLQLHSSDYYEQEAFNFSYFSAKTDDSINFVYS